MNTKKTLPMLAAVAALAIGSGTYMAVAQDSGTEPATIERQNDGERGERRGGRHGEKHAGRHGKMGGRHGHHRGHRKGDMMRNAFEQADTDGNRELTRAEIDAFRASLVGNADASGDGALSIDEFDTAFRQLTRIRMVRAFQRLDRDGNGVIDAAEMDRPLERMIERMDRDGDGILKMRDRRGGERG